MRRARSGRAALAAALALLCASLVSAPLSADPGSEAPAEGALEPDYAAGLKAIEVRDWNEAIRRLSSAALRDTRNADLANYLAYAYRNAGDLARAFQLYHRALLLNPRHRGAHEYLGEAYLMIGNLPKAEEHLGALRKICLLPCEEQGHLEQKIAEYRARERQ